MNSGSRQSISRLALSVTVLFAAVVLAAGVARAQKTPAKKQVEAVERSSYKIALNVDFDELSYSGTEYVRWVNDGEKSSSLLYFHLYPNLRSPEQPATSANSVDEPRLEVLEVLERSSPLPFSFEDQGATLRINLLQSVAPGLSTEISIRFKGTVPEIDPEETGLASHVVKQVSAALRAEREIRRSRDINFRCRGVMLLGTAYPVLAVHDGDEWRRKVEATVGDILFAESADYEVTLETSPSLPVFAPGVESSSTGGERQTKTFKASALREFPILVGRGLHSEQVEVQGVTVTSIYLREHERVGKRVLAIAASALKTFTSAFGPLPFRNISIAEAPLVAGLGSTEFSGFNVIASAFYVDFDAPMMRNLPEIIREQRPAVEESLEWTVGHLTAHQWWGGAVGNDPAREPVLDEALSCWSALLYYKAAYGPEKAAAVLDDQVRGVYRLYRTFGGEDMDANRPSRDFQNTFQYAAIVTAKGALMFNELQGQLGEEKLFAALRSYYQANMFEIAELDDLRGALFAEAPIEQRRTVARTFSRWMSGKRGDEDIAPPDAELAASLGVSNKQAPQRGGQRTAFTAFAKLGKFFWQQMTRIR
jgi:hypothetical protein